MNISLTEVRSPAITKPEKKTANILACLLSEYFQGKPVVNPRRVRGS
jgi:hypothetical protein